MSDRGDNITLRVIDVLAFCGCILFGVLGLIGVITEFQDLAEELFNVATW